MKNRWITSAVLALLLGVALRVGCAETGAGRGERAVPEPAPRASSSAPAGPLTASAAARARSSSPGMTVLVTAVEADPTLDAQAIRRSLRDAETALLSCLDPGGSTGVLVLSFPVEHDGAVGNVIEGSQTTYGSEDARVCVARLIAAMRLPRGRGDQRAEVRVTLEVQELH
jgi:hypothetical protein